MTDPRDPLAGLDPYPRDLIDTLGLHPERADLLEDIVSTPGPAHPTTARTRALLAIGIAAAVAVIGGGWFLAAGAGGHDDSTPVAAASATTATDATTAPTATNAPSASASAGGTGLPGCRQLPARGAQLRGILPLLQNRRGHRHERLYVRTLKGKRYVVIVGRGCTIRALRSLSATRH